MIRRAGGDYPAASPRRSSAIHSPQPARAASRRPWRANARATSSPSAASRPLAISARGGGAPPKTTAATASSSGRSRLASMVGADGAGPSRVRSWRRTATPTPFGAPLAGGRRSAPGAVGGRVGGGRAQRLVVVVEPAPGPPAGHGGRDREDARAAPEVDQPTG